MNTNFSNIHHKLIKISTKKNLNLNNNNYLKLKINHQKINLSNGITIILKQVNRNNWNNNNYPLSHKILMPHKFKIIKITTINGLLKNNNIGKNRNLFNSH